MENITREALRSLNVPDEAIEEILKARGSEITKTETERNQPQPKTRRTPAQEERDGSCQRESGSPIGSR